VEAALDNLTLTALSLDPSLGRKPLPEIGDAIFDLFGLRPPLEDLESSVARLSTVGKLLADPSGDGLVPAEEAKHEIEERARTAAELEGMVRTEWLNAISGSDAQVSLPADAIWDCLQSFMAKVFRRHGAQTLALLAPDLPVLAQESGFRTFLDEARRESGLENYEEGLVEGAIETFFNSGSEVRARYLTQLLDGTFTFFALTVDETTAEFLRGQVRPLSLFLDTNFIFAILELADDYFTEVSADLLGLVRDQGFPFTLYYHERTLREIRDTIHHFGGRLRGRQWSQSLSSAAVTYGQATGAISGVELAFHRLNSREKTDPSIFLSRYDHVETLLEAKGFKIFRETGTLGYTTAEKGEVIAEYEDFVRTARPERPKPYEALDHDMVVLMRVDRLRNSRTSVLDAGALFLTNDYILHRFVWRVLRSHGEIGAAVLPRQLLQILRPFVPSTDDFDRRFAEAFAIPEFRALQGNYGPVASNVLSYLATFRDLPEETALQILGDTILQNRLRGLPGDSPAFSEAVDTAISVQNRQLVEERNELRASLAESTQAAAGAAERLTQERQELQDRIRQLESGLKSRESELERAKGTEQQLSGELASAREHEQALLQSAKARDRRTRAILLTAAMVVGGIAIWILPMVGLLPWLSEHPRRLGLQIAFSTLWAAAVWAVIERRNIGVVFTVVILGGLLTVAQLIDLPTP
jgi:hypothetical protein